VPAAQPPFPAIFWGTLSERLSITAVTMIAGLRNGASHNNLTLCPDHRCSLAARP
jgi:hypothetical protein